MKIYILITGKQIKAYVSLAVLCRFLKLDKNYVKDNLPIEHEKFRIVEVDLNEKAF